MPLSFKLIDLIILLYFTILAQQYLMNYSIIKSDKFYSVSRSSLHTSNYKYILKLSKSNFYVANQFS